MQLPQTASDFNLFMTDIWRMDMVPTDDGVVITGHPDYFEYEDAIETAIKCGAVKRYPGKVDGMAGYCFAFPDGSKINITCKGDGLQLVNVQRSRRSSRG